MTQPLLIAISLTEGVLYIDVCIALELRHADKSTKFRAYLYALINAWVIILIS